MNLTPNMTWRSIDKTGKVLEEGGTTWWREDNGGAKLLEVTIKWKLYEPRYTAKVTEYLDELCNEPNAIDVRIWNVFKKRRLGNLEKYNAKMKVLVQFQSGEFVVMSNVEKFPGAKIYLTGRGSYRINKMSKLL